MNSFWLFLRAAFWTVLLPGLLAGYIPWRYFRVRNAELSGVADVPGLVLIGIGLIILLASIVEFDAAARSTLSPVDPPKQLVVEGPYRWVCNPMYTGVMCILIGEILIGADFDLIIYAAAVFVGVNLFIARYEEPYLERAFGSSYMEYKRHVRRWIPRLTPWTP